MNKQIGIALGLLVVLGGVFLVLNNRQPVGLEELDYELPVIDEIVRVELQREGETIVLEQNDGAWRMTQPVDFAVADRRVEAISEAFAGSHAVLLSRGEDRATALGMDDGLVAQIEGADGTTFHARIGASPDESDSTWIWPDGESTLYRVGVDLRAVFDFPSDDFRDDRIFDLESADVTGLELVSGGQTVMVERADSDSDWELTQPAGVQIDPTLVNRIVNGMARLVSVEFADDVTAEAAGISAGSARLTLHTADGLAGTVIAGDPVPGEDGEDSGQVYIAREGIDAVFVVRETSANRIRTTLGEIREQTIADGESDDIFTIAFAEGETLLMTLEQVVTIEDGESDEAPNDHDEHGHDHGHDHTHGHGDEPTIERSWQLLGDAETALNGTDVRLIGRYVATVEASRFADGVDEANAGLLPPERTITVTMADGSQRVIEIGGRTEPAELDEGVGDRYARVDGGDIFEISQSRAAALLSTLEDIVASSESDGE